ncbi:uncharacterized protein LOC132748300 [Ruditapes philippinarum]|uniref:uncharacterized protein LOC132748300 n=1 Tax=Ruditapes philippinarum TaxID=129788 RepID=UPI00295A9D08|nr:uncharacterized protein LOC132748300 [Ruditapes philippinarum]
MSDSTESSAYFYRIISLVVDVGTETLRDIFYWKVPKLNVATLFATPEVQSEFKRLKGKKALTEVQYAKVTNKPDPDTYDISLLTTLLTNQKICRISKPKDGWGKVPDPSDISLGADLLRLREIRNEIIAHRNKAQLEVEDYKKIWGNVEIVLLRLAANIDASEKDKVKEKIRSAETRVLEPFHDREKKLLQVFIEWQKEDNKKTEVQLSDISNKLENLHLKVDGLKTPADETDAARSNVTSEDTLSSIQSQVSSVLENLGSIATQDDVSQIQANMKRMEDNVKAISDLVKILKETVEKSNHNLEELSKNAHISGCQPMSAIFERDQGRQFVPDRPKKPKIENPHAMTDKEILELSKKIGYEWESLRIHLDFTEAQGHALKWAFNDDVQVRIYQMLKGWHDVVVDCGENPKKLLAAAFVNASTNYQMAYSIVPKQQFDPNAEAKPATVARIQKISFSKTGFDQGDVFHDRPGSGASYRPAGPPAGPSSFNVYGGDVTIGGLGMHQPQSSSSSNVASDSFDGSGSRDTSFGSVNIHGGKVAISNMAMGPATQVSGFPSYNQLPTVRGEMTSIVPDVGKPQHGSFLSSGQPFKKENDDTLSQSMVAALGEQMKSVGALISAGNIVGTVFRVGTKYVMTASHVVSMVIDPHNNRKS